MNQILHILKKDFRRFAFEIALTLVVLALYTWMSPLTWLPPEPLDRGAFMRHNEPALLAVLLVMGWTILLVRLIQEESPAGDRQFWVTRPYQWPRLLAAKVLFMLLVVTVPLLIARMAMLAMAGFSPVHYLAGLLQIHLPIMALILPVAALIAVTSGLMQISRAALALLLFLAAAWALDSTLPGAAAWHGSSAWNLLQNCLLIGVPLMVIVGQYARRKTNHARLWLLAGALVTLALAAATPYRQLIERDYPLPPAGEQPVFGLLQLYPVTEQGIRSDGKQAWISLELAAGNLAPGYLAEVRAILVTLEAPDGTRWDSGWQPNYAFLAREIYETREPGQTAGYRFNSRLQMDRRMFDRLKDVPLKARVAVAATVFREHEGSIVKDTQDQFELPGVGICAIRGRPAGMLWCRSAPRRPTLVGVTGHVFLQCPPSADDLAKPLVQTTGWAGWVGSGARQFNFLSGVRQLNFLFSNWDFDLSPVSNFVPNMRSVPNMPLRVTNIAYINYFGPCPGLPLSFRQPEMVSKVRVEADFDDFRISTAPTAKQ